MEDLTGSSDPNKANNKLRSLQDELHRLQSEFERLSVHNEEKESSLQSQKQKVISLQEALTRKECELASLEERYKKYVEKAKSVIKTLDPKQQGGSPSEMGALRSREDKDKRKEESPETKIFREMEEKLMISAFYNFGLTRHRDAVDQRLAVLASGQGQSFLARQRQPASRKLYTTYNSK